MATWTAPTTRSTGDLISASIWNTDLVENLKYLKDAPVFTGVVTITAGTVTAPALTTAGDTNTGLWFPGADTVALTAGGVEQLRATSTAIGIGVTPSAWDATFNVLEGLGGAFYSGSTSAMRVGQGFYYAGALKYKHSSVAAGLLSLTSGGLVFSNAPAGTAGNTATFTDRFTVNLDGTIKTGSTISVGNATPSTSGAGITFPASQSASSDANTLDDYEEGSFTPVDSSGASLSFVQASGTYTKIGRVVIASGVVEYPSTANASNTLIGGLPFTPVNAAQNRGGIVTWANLASIAYVLTGAGTTDFRIYANDGSILANSTVSTKTIIFQFVYYV